MRIDHDRRRTALAEAVWRLILREGVRGASVRGVAREAGLSMGSVRYFFATQDELLHFAMREVVRRAGDRVRARTAQRRASAGDPVAAAIDRLEQVLPLDAERLTEARVWLAFTVHGMTDSVVREIHQQADQEVRELCRTCLRESDLLESKRDITQETDRLWALLDGLTLHILWDPTPPDPSAISGILRRHLGDLAAAPTNREPTPRRAR